MKFDPALPDDSVNVSKEHPLSEMFTLVAGIVGSVIVLVVGITLAVDVMVVKVPADVEVKVFETLGSELDQLDGVEEDDPRTPKLQALVDRLAQGWPENPYRFQVAVMQSESVNAMAVPGGVILVTSGLLEKVKSENELAFVLGHEIGHFSRRHHLRRMGRVLTLGLVMASLLGTSAGASTNLPSMVAEIAGSRFDRNQESEADAFGLELLEGVYGHVQGAQDFFEHIPSDPSGAGAVFSRYMATHPLSGERKRRLSAHAQKQGFAAEGALTALVLPDAPPPSTESKDDP